jgi:hypothetical protein
MLAVAFDEVGLFVQEALSFGIVRPSGAVSSAHEDRQAGPVPLVKGLARKAAELGYRLEPTTATAT